MMLLFTPPTAFSITLDDAVKRGVDVSFPIKEQKETIQKTEFSYFSTIDDYLPRVELRASYLRYLNVAREGSTYGGSSGANYDRDAYNTTGAISYRLFDGGYRSARRQGSFSVLGREKEKLEEIRVDVLYNLKNAFYTALGRKNIVEKRAEAYETTKKVYELTKARFSEGIAKKSDVLQSEVRMTAVRIELAEAENDHAKSLEDLKSLLLIAPDDNEDVEGLLETPTFREGYEGLVVVALARRPDVAYQVKEVERLTMVYKEKQSDWWPKLDAQLQQQRQDKAFYSDNRTDTFMLSFSYPLFDGVGRHYNAQGARKDVNAARYRLEEIKRNVRLEIIKAYKDYELSLENIRMYAELLREADSNFNQALGEYKAGKGDILSLLIAERDWAKAKENHVAALYKSNNAFAYLEKVSYLSGN